MDMDTVMDMDMDTVMDRDMDKATAMDMDIGLKIISRYDACAGALM